MVHSDDGLDAQLSHCVEDLLSIKALEMCSPSVELNAVYNLIVDHWTKALVEGVSSDASDSEGDVEVSGAAKVASVLGKLGGSNPELGPVVANIIKVVDQKSSQGTTAPLSADVLEEPLRALLGGSGNPLQQAQMSKASVASEAITTQGNVQAARAAVKLLEGPLTASDVWANPVEAVAQHIGKNGSTNLQFQGYTGLHLQHFRNFMMDLIAQCPRTKFSFSADMFFQRGDGDPSWEDIAHGLNTFIATGLSSVVAELGAGDFKGQRDQVIEFLRSVGEKIDRARLEVVVAPPAQGAGSGTPDGKSVCFVMKANGKTHADVYVDLRSNDPDSEPSLRQLRQATKIKFLPLCTSAMFSLLDHFVIPSVTANSPASDKNGFVGYVPANIGTHFSGAQLGEIVVPSIDQDFFARQPSIKVLYTKSDRRDSPALPVFQQDDSLVPAGGL